jgi:hypothetical protein
MKTTAITALLCLLSGALAANEANDREAVIQLIADFFAAMTARDVDRMQTLMTEDGIIYGYRETPEGLQIIRPTHAEYLENLASGEGRVVERFWNPEVMLEDRLATVWTRFDLHRDGVFSHCGINNFSMLNTDSGWVITGVVFSIEVENCAPSPLGPFRENER